MTIFVLFILAASLLMLSSMVLLYLRRVLMASPGKSYRARVLPESLSDYVLDNLHATGIYVPKLALHLITFFFIAVVISLSILMNAWLGVLILVSGIILANAYVKLRVRSVRQKIVEQMPNFLEQMNRNLVSGQSLEVAFSRLSGQVEYPLQHSVTRIKARRDYGQELYDSVKHEARIIGSFELELLSTIFQVNLQYGGAVRQALESFVGMLRQRERSRRELKALTGETRVTAWVLSLVPILVLVAVLIASPGYLNPMIESSSGRFALGVAAGMQLLGLYLIRRMMRFN